MTDLRAIIEGLDPECPLCGNQLVVYRDRNSKRAYIGCLNHRCAYTEELPDNKPAQPPVFQVDANSGKGVRE